MDDLKQTSHNEVRDLVVKQAVDSAIQIYECLEAERFVMSGKNDITATHPRTRQIVLHHLRLRNVNANLPDEARHLGLGNRAGRGRPIVLKKARFLKSQTRIDHIARYATRKRSAAKLYPTGAWPMRYYGYSATGFIATDIKKAQKMPNDVQGSRVPHVPLPPT